MKLTPYSVACPKLRESIKIALLADIHGDFEKPILPLLQEADPNLILIAGDLTEQKEILSGGAESLRFLSSCRDIAPVVYASGNHEVGCFRHGNPNKHPTPQPLPDFYLEELEKLGILSVENEEKELYGIHFCGLGTGIDGRKNKPNLSLLDSFSALPEEDIKILLCHHPEYYPVLRNRDFDLIVCGHAHGGQWRFFGHGIYAPGQGLFPRYTSGLHGGNCVISRGISGNTRIPRIFNEPEIPVITFGG